MSNLIFNLRIFYWHFQIKRDSPYVQFGFNSYRWHRRAVWPWIELT